MCSVECCVAQLLGCFCALCGYEAHLTATKASLIYVYRLFYVVNEGPVLNLGGGDHDENEAYPILAEHMFLCTMRLPCGNVSPSIIKHNIDMETQPHVWKVIEA